MPKAPRAIERKSLNATELKNRIAKGKIISKPQNLSTEQMKNAKAQYERLIKAEMERNKTRRPTQKPTQKFIETTNRRSHLNKLMEAIRFSGVDLKENASAAEVRDFFKKNTNKQILHNTLEIFWRETFNIYDKSHENPREMRRTLAEVGIGAREIISANIEYPVQKLLWLEFTKAEIQPILERNPVLKHNYEKQLNALIDSFCKKEHIDLLTKNIEIQATRYAQTALINAIKGGYREEIIRRIQSGLSDSSRISNISENHKRKLIEQVRRISMRGSN